MEQQRKNNQAKESSDNNIYHHDKNHHRKSLSQNINTHNFDWAVFLSALVAGIFGFVAHVADLYTCLPPSPPPLHDGSNFVDERSNSNNTDFVVKSHHDILTIEKAYGLIKDKPNKDFEIGHVLAMIFIPLGFLGTYHLYNILLIQHTIKGVDKDWKYRALRIIVVMMMFITYVAGTIMHCTWTFMSLILNFVTHHTTTNNNELFVQELMQVLQPYFEFTSGFTINYMLNLANVSIVGLILLRQLPWNRYMVLVTPIPTIGTLQHLGAVLLPLRAQIYIAVASYNLSSGILWTSAAIYYAINYQTMFDVVCNEEEEEEDGEKKSTIVTKQAKVKSI